MARSEVNYIYEADTAFRGPGESALTASGEVGTFALDKMVNARSGDQKNKLGAEGYAIVIAVESIDLTDANATYVFDIEIQATGGGNAVTAVTFPVVGTGQHVISLDANTLEKLSADREELSLNLTVGGTPPATPPATASPASLSITFAAWVAPVR